MGHKVKQSLMSSRIDFFYYAFRNVLLVSIPLLVVSGVVLSHLSFHSSAASSSSGSTSSTDSLSFSISSSCTLSSVVDSSHTAELINGTYTNGIGKTTITTLCNDGNGYSVYAVGYSNNEEGNNRLVNAESSNFNIVSGTAESGNTSNWAMSLNNLKDDPSLTPPTITLDYDGIYGIVPDRWTKVASLPARATDMIKGSSFTTTYAVYTSSSQYAGTYNGQVKYMLTHPNSNASTMNDIDAAFWLAGKQKVYSDENGSYFAMQDMTSDICNSVSNNDERTSTQLVDIRDNKLYWVTKLKDGHCWMTQNLDFDIAANTTLNSQTTDLNVVYDSSTGQYAEYNDGYTEDNGITYYTPAGSATTIGFQNTGPITGWQNSNTASYTANKTDSTETGHFSLGNYYNWTAAIASNNSSSLTQNTLSDISKNPKNSICPKGWRLPTISNQSGSTLGSTNEFTRLNFLYNNNLYDTGIALTEAPLYFARPGYIYNNSVLEDSSNGFYYSSTINSGNTAYNLSFSLGKISPETPYGGTYGYRSAGKSVRCVAK